MGVDLHIGITQPNKWLIDTNRSQITLEGTVQRSKKHTQIIHNNTVHHALEPCAKESSLVSETATQVLRPSGDFQQVCMSLAARCQHHGLLETGLVVEANGLESWLAVSSVRKPWFWAG